MSEEVVLESKPEPQKIKKTQEMQEFHYTAWQQNALAQIEKALEQFTSQSEIPEPLQQAMRYAVLGTGKRLRPLLVLASAWAVDVPEFDDTVMRAACAVELIHAYSLVHDDMPCMDNDVLRRGQPTVHVKYGEALAMLTGDALQALAFEILTPVQSEIYPSVQAKQVGLLARAAGGCGMAGGQAIDLCHVGETLNQQQLQHMHSLKTGQLLSCCVAMGMTCTKQELTPEQTAAMTLFGHNMGLAFQIVDDILDVTQDSSVIGKTAGKDAQAGKPTYVSLLGLEAARQCVHTLYDQACEALDNCGLENIHAMQAIANHMVSRSF